MFLINTKPLGYFSLCLFGALCACSHENSDGIAGSGGAAAFQTGAGGATEAFDPETYCDGIFKGQHCGVTQIEADIKTVNMLLVIDKSNSMNSPASSATTESKWAEMKRALRVALTAVQDDINFGLVLFPYDPTGVVGSDSTSSCSVPTDADAISVSIAEGSKNLTKILDVLDHQTPAGGTPTLEALIQAYTYFTEGDGKDAPGKKAVLLATDGGPNCNPTLTCEKETCTHNMDLKCANGTPDTTQNCCANTASIKDANLGCLDDLAVVGQIAKLAVADVDTYVIGIPGSEAYAATLNSMADAGRVPSTSGFNGETYYAVSATNSMQDLQYAFEDITTKLVTSCDIPLSQAPTQPDLVQVAKDCNIVPMLSGNKPPADDAGSSGFYVDYRTDAAHLMLTGSYCENISVLGAKNLDVIVGCTTLE